MPGFVLCKLDSGVAFDHLMVFLLVMCTHILQLVLLSKLSLPILKGPNLT